MAELINEVHNMTYEPIKIIQLTLATGGSIDWFYSDAGNINNEYRAAGLAFELRDIGQEGFLLPPAQVMNRYIFIASVIFLCNSCINLNIPDTKGNIEIVFGRKNPGC